MGNAKTTVGLVYGGKSGEHEVSLQTAYAVMNAFDYDKYEIIPFYISKQGYGRWVQCWRLPSPRLSSLSSPGLPEIWAWP